MRGLIFLSYCNDWLSRGKRARSKCWKEGIEREGIKRGGKSNAYRLEEDGVVFDFFFMAPWAMI